MINQTAHPSLLGFDVIFVATVLAAIATAAVIVAIYAAVGVRDPMARRMKLLNARRDELKSGLITGPRRRSLRRNTVVTDRLRNILKSLRMLQDSQIAEVVHKLAQAGLRKQEFAYFVIAGRVIMPLLLGIGTALAVYGSQLFPDWSSLTRFLAFAAAVVAGYKAPDLFLKNLVTKRTDAIRKGLPDALDLLVICAEAGLTVDAAFGRVAKELGRAYPELADEFTLASIELSFLSERRKAFENLARRVHLEAMKGVVTTMIQTERYGTPLASTLRVLAAEFRNERMMRAEEKAARLPAIMTVPLILFILPVLFIVILGPAACSIADNLL
ncbi:type II secretion system F family protein [Croceicoccus sp. F390]|uniref:Type II secretion system F family protein n=1 Tax=Croceicoccus esteveae TaxID=3075597 RepID=A0ABU2ZGH9_9SPHN|nr:type II secretion system F family protein [Croceicoccus sp. F390]MDT0575696.1 type II secretion system F family protein [Croceicoccus sp. F390]